MAVVAVRPAEAVPPLPVAGVIEIGCPACARRQINRWPGRPSTVKMGSGLMGLDPAGAQDPADRRGADPVAEFEQFALDPVVAGGRFSLAVRSCQRAVTASIGGCPG